MHIHIYTVMVICLILYRSVDFWVGIYFAGGLVSELSNFVSHQEGGLSRLIQNNFPQPAQNWIEIMCRFVSFSKTGIPVNLNCILGIVGEEMSMLCVDSYWKTCLRRNPG